MSGYALRVEPEPSPPLREQILAPLARYNEAQVGPSGFALFAVTVRDAEDAVVGGLWARMAFGYMFVELLSSGPGRNQGLGRQMMAMAEAEARARGLLGIWLDSWTFQAPEFYRKLGFMECGRIADYPPGHDRIFFVKRFDAVTS